jgi:hypothetical protein
VWGVYHGINEGCADGTQNLRLDSSVFKTPDIDPFIRAQYVLIMVKL